MTINIYNTIYNGHAERVKPRASAKKTFLHALGIRIKATPPRVSHIMFVYIYSKPYICNVTGTLTTLYGTLYIMLIGRVRNQKNVMLVNSANLQAADSSR